MKFRKIIEKVLSMKIKEIFEKVLSILLAVAGITVAILDLFGIGNISEERIASFSLLILGTITVFVFMEVSRLHVIDNNAKLLESIDKKTSEIDNNAKLIEEIDKRTSKIDNNAKLLEEIDKKTSEIDNNAKLLESINERTQELLHGHYSGIYTIYQKFPLNEFNQRIPNARKIRILNTWIPNLQNLTEPLVQALNNGTEVNILLLYPKSAIAELRSEALQSVTNPVPPDNVKRGVEDNLDLLAFISKRVESEKRNNLQVKVFNSLPSVSIYQTNELALVGVFFHGALAINTPQLEVHENSSVLGQSIKKEFNILWSIGHEITDLEDWRRELDLMTGRI